MAARSRSGAVFVLAAVLFSVNARPLDGQVNGPAPPSPISPLPVYGRSIARVTSGSGSLPNHHGQVWREYDLSPYTLRVTSTNRPEQAVVDWILRETGYELWHSEPLGILSASERTLRVYHTPQVQAVVAGIVDRFVNPDTETHGFSLRMITVDGPNWRSRPPLLRLLTPIQVQSPGAQAWLLEKEGVAALLAELRRRSDFREHNSPNLLVGNGQSTVIQAKQGRSYVRNLVPRPEMWPGYQPETGLIDEGFALELSPLLSLDGRMIDAFDQVRDRPGRRHSPGVARHADSYRDPPTHESRGASSEPLPLPRAVPLASGAGAPGQHGNGSRACPWGRQVRLSASVGTTASRTSGPRGLQGSRRLAVAELQREQTWFRSLPMGKIDPL